jgi:hypothetical protein
MFFIVISFSSHIKKYYFFVKFFSSSVVKEIIGRTTFLITSSLPGLNFINTLRAAFCTETFCTYNLGLYFFEGRKLKSCIYNVGETDARFGIFWHWRIRLHLIKVFFLHSYANTQAACVCDATRLKRKKKIAQSHFLKPY